MAHDSYCCLQYPQGSRPFLTRRKSNEFVGRVYLEIIPLDSGVNFTLVQCPKQCRPSNHLDWIYCWWFYTVETYFLFDQFKNNRQTLSLWKSDTNLYNKKITIDWTWQICFIGHRLQKCPSKGIQIELHGGRHVEVRARIADENRPGRRRLWQRVWRDVAAAHSAALAQGIVSSNDKADDGTGVGRLQVGRRCWKPNGAHLLFVGRNGRSAVHRRLAVWLLFGLFPLFSHPGEIRSVLFAKQFALLGRRILVHGFPDVILGVAALSQANHGELVRAASGQTDGNGQ